MKLRPLLLSLALVLPGHAAEPAHISIAELVNPETCLAALNRLLITSSSKYTPGLEADEPPPDPKNYAALRIEKLARTGEAPRYAVTWHQRTEEEWHEGKPASHPVAMALTPAPLVSLAVISAQGTLLFYDYTFTDSVIADLSGRGAPEVIESSSIPLAAGDEAEPDILEYLYVHPPAHPFEDVETTLVIAFNRHPPSRAAGNTWGYQVSGPAADGTYAIQLGPVLAPEGVEPQVTFRWDKAREAWTGPALQSGDHFQVLAVRHLEEVANAAAGFKYPLAPELRAEPSASAPGDFQELLANTPPPANPYAYRSLAGLSNEALLSWFAREHGAGDYRADRLASACAVPDFWSLPPRQAALSYIRHNRPPQDAPLYLLTIPGEAEAAPDEGDLTVSTVRNRLVDGYVYHLHCGRSHSFVAYAFAPQELSMPAWLTERESFDFRELDLTYDEARQLLQTAWWMHRIRSRMLVKQDGFVPSSTGAFANLILKSAADEFEEGGFLNGDVFPAGGNYKVSAFVSVAAQLFTLGIPCRFGTGWRSLTSPRQPAPPLPATTEKLKMRAAELLAAFNRGELSRDALRAVVAAAGSYGWADLKPGLAQAATLLPAPDPDEQQVIVFLADYRVWVTKLGVHATSLNESIERGIRRRHGGTRIPLAQSRRGGESDVPTRFVPPLSTEEEAKYGDFDRRYEECLAVVDRMSDSAQGLAGLRAELAQTLRQLAIWDDAEALYIWGSESPDALEVAVRRLAEIDPARATELLQAASEWNDESPAKERAAETNELLGARPLADVNSQVATQSGRNSLIEILSDRTARAAERARALELLVPLNEPQRYAEPEIEHALLELLNRERDPKEQVPHDLPLIAVRRLGCGAWSGLVEYARDPARFIDAVPALTLLAERDPERRPAMLDLFQPELRDGYGRLDDVLWSIWSLDLRELKPDLERIATGGPDDYESKLAKEIVAERTPTEGRYHLARQIAALWNEEDSLTRARLLIVFGLAHADRLSEGGPDAVAHLARQLEEAWRGLSAEQRGESEKLVHWCEENAYPKLQAPIERAAFEAVLRAIWRIVADARAAGAPGRFPLTALRRSGSYAP